MYKINYIAALAKYAGNLSCVSSLSKNKRRIIRTLVEININEVNEVVRLRYPREVIEEISSGNDILDVVSAYVPLKQKGSNYFGLCPFHNEKSPSFSVTPDKQIFHCFGCGVGGNVISFIMQIENLDFLGAITFLADRIRYALPEAGHDEDYQKRALLKESLIDIHKKAARFFYDTLQSQDGAAATAYLDIREMQPKIRTKFGLGYASPRRDALYRFLQKQGFEPSLIAQSGLVIADKKGGYFDRFSSRLMFPIFDAFGVLVGFGGRILDKGEPKYLNSPETPIFDKSRNLYGINFARRTRLKEWILVEGYMDVISIYQAGFPQVVAALGTAFNAEHAKIIKRYADSVVVLFDSDDAGTKATLRAIPFLLSAGLKVRVLQVSGAKDPDEYIKKFGSHGFASLLKTAKSHILFRVDTLKQRYDLSDVDQKIQFTAEAGKIVSELDSAIERDAYIREISDYVKLSQDAIRDEVEKQNSTPAANTKSRRNLSYREANKLKEKGLHDAQKNVLYILSTHQEAARRLTEHLQADEMGAEVYRRMLEIIYDYARLDKPVIPGTVINEFEALEDQKTAVDVFASATPYSDYRTLEKSLNESLRVVKRASLDEKITTETDMNHLNKLIQNKRNIEKLYITISDG